MRFVFWFPATFALAACDPAIHVAGRVHAPTGEPVPEAEVTLAVADQPRREYAWTDSAGRFVVSRLGPAGPPFVLRICSDSFQLAERTFASKEALRDSVHVVLIPRSDSIAYATTPSRCSLPARAAP
jgi:hypothetical protein